MKVSFVAAALALAAPVFAQSPLDSLPDCAASCLVTSLAKSGCANPTDLECVCGSEAFVTAAATCIIASCEGDDESSAIQGAYQLCLANGVTIPTVFPGQEGGASSTSAAPVESSTAAAEETATEAPTEEPTEVPEVTTTFTTITGTGSGPVPTNGTNTQPPVPTATEGAATRMGVSLGALGLAIAGFVAL